MKIRLVLVAAAMVVAGCGKGGEPAAAPAQAPRPASSAPGDPLKGFLETRKGVAPAASRPLPTTSQEILKRFEAAVKAQEAASTPSPFGR